MTELIRFTRILLEDLDIGLSLREVRLADGRVMLLQQIHPGNLAILQTAVIKSSAGASTLTLTGFLQAGMRIMGVTTQNLITFGTTNGLTAFVVGDGVNIDRWGQSTGLTAGTKTEQPQFRDTTWPVFPAANDVVISALGGTFDATGQIEVTAHYFPLVHRRAG